MGGLSIRSSTILSLVGLVVVLGTGFVFLKDGRTKDVERLFALNASQVTSQVAGATRASPEGAAGGLSSSLLGPGQVSPSMFVTVVERLLQQTFQSTATFETIRPWDGAIFETLTPYPELVSVEEYRYVLTDGEMSVYFIEARDAGITDTYQFLYQLATKANRNDRVIVQEIAGLARPAFYYIHLDKPQKVRIVSQVTSTLAVALDAPVSAQSALSTVLSSLRL